MIKILCLLYTSLVSHRKIFTNKQTEQKEIVNGNKCKHKFSYRIIQMLSNKLSTVCNLVIKFLMVYHSNASNAVHFDKINSLNSLN